MSLESSSATAGSFFSLVASTGFHCTVPTFGGDTTKLYVSAWSLFWVFGFVGEWKGLLLSGIGFLMRHLVGWFLCLLLVLGMRRADARSWSWFYLF